MPQSLRGTNRHLEFSSIFIFYSPAVLFRTPLTTLGTYEGTNSGLIVDLISFCGTVRCCTGTAVAVFPDRQRTEVLEYSE